MRSTSQSSAPRPPVSLSAGGRGNGFGPAGLNFSAPGLAPRSNSIGTLILGLYLVSGYATDVMMLSMGVKPYLSTLAGLVVLVLFVISGRALRGLQTIAGKLWLFMLIWLVIDLPFSNWPGGSAELIWAYLPKAHMILFFICALALAAEDCRKLVLANIAGCFALLFECVRFGVADENGRLAIPTSISFSNPNDLGLQLVVSIGFFVYLVVSKSWLARIAGLAGMLASFYFMLRTASRGSEIACGVMALFAVVFTSYRFKVILLAIPVAIVVLSMPGDTLHRLSLIFLNPAAESFATARDRASVGSQMERQELLLASIEYMFTHPLFGIGPGQFSDYRWMTSKQVGEHVASLGTHNSYTEIGSECGMPALFCYAGVVFWSIRSNYRILKRTQSDPDRQLFARLSLCLLMSTLGFAVNAFFHHSGYSAYVPVLGGLSIVLCLAADPVQKWPDQPGKR